MTRNFVVVWIGISPQRQCLKVLVRCYHCLFVYFQTMEDGSLVEERGHLRKFLLHILFLTLVHTSSSFLSRMRWQMYLSDILTIVTLLPQHMRPSKHTLTSWKLLLKQTLPPFLSHLSLLSFSPHKLLRSLLFFPSLNYLPLLFWTLQQNDKSHTPSKPQKVIRSSNI